jgi:vitamin B12 transporter
MKHVYCSLVRARLLAIFLFSPSIFSLTYAQVIEINPVEVTATRMEQKLSDAIPAVSVITKEEIVRSHAGDISELLAGQAGIEFARNGGIGAPISIYMRGSGSTQTMVLVDGIPFSSQDATG